MRQRLAAMAAQPSLIPVTPQRRRQSARTRLAERTGSVAARILKDLGLSRNGRDIFRVVGGMPAANVQVVTQLLNKQINKSLDIGRGARKILTADQTEWALAQLDALGDRVRDELAENLEGDGG
jgi:hypothetical protein